MTEAARIDEISPEALRDGLEAAGICPEPVQAACVLRQGRSPTIASTVLLYGLVRLFFGGGSQQLPRIFALCVGRDCVRAYRARGIVTADGYRVTVYPGEEASWPRAEVAVGPGKPGLTLNAELVVPGGGGAERVRVTTPNSGLDPALEAISAVLGPAS